MRFKLVKSVSAEFLALAVGFNNLLVLWGLRRLVMKLVYYIVVLIFVGVIGFATRFEFMDFLTVVVLGSLLLNLELLR